MSALVGVDVGGTFTDVVTFRDGKVQVTKVPSVPDEPECAVLEGARRIGVADVAVFNHASTKGLNALLTRSLPKIGFLATEGHRDVLDQGRAWRPWNGQLDPRWRRPFGDAARPLVERYLRRGIRERILADGTVHIPLDEAQALHELRVLQRCGIQGLAICLLHAWRDPIHERRLLALAREVFGEVFPISVSHQVGARIKEYPRASTTTIDVLMKLIYEGYATRLHEGLQAQGFGGTLHFADCSAALLPWRDALEAPHRILFAGPAAGAASCVALGRAIGDGNLIGCDVGGTSTDVTLIAGGEPFVNDTFELEWDMVVNTLATEVSSVGAGGGSIVAVSSSGDITVGPASAGAAPGPACYGRGGTRPTVTDACLVMGILDPDGFAGGQMRLDVAAARRAFEGLQCAMPFDERVATTWRVALGNIAEEVVNVAIRHGADPRDFSLVAFGAGGPMLLAGALELTGARRLVVPPHPGLFSALGLLSIDRVHATAVSAHHLLVPDAVPAIGKLLGDMEASLRSRLPDGMPATVRRSFDGRVLEQSWDTPFVPIAPGPLDARALVHAFHTEYQRRNGQSFPDMPVQGVAWRVQLVAHSPKIEWPEVPAQRDTPRPVGTRRVRHLVDGEVIARIYDRAQLGAGAALDGPCIIREDLATTLVMPGQRATVGRIGEIVIERLP